MELIEPTFSYFLRLTNTPDSNGSVSSAVAAIARMVKARYNRDLSDYQEKALSEYLEKIWSEKGKVTE